MGLLCADYRVGGAYAVTLLLSESKRIFSGLCGISLGLNQCVCSGFLSLERFSLFL